MLVKTSLHFPSKNYQILDKRKSVSDPSTAHRLCANAGGKAEEYLNDYFITEQNSLSNLSATWLGISHFDTITREPVLQMNVQMLKKKQVQTHMLQMSSFCLIRCNLDASSVEVSPLAFSLPGKHVSGLRCTCPAAVVVFPNDKHKKD